VARVLCLWTGKLPEDHQEKADEVLLGAAADGLGLADLAGLFAEIYERSRAEEPGQDEDESFEDRALRLVTTLGGAGVLHGDLNPDGTTTAWNKDKTKVLHSHGPPVRAG
jgi:hypothetical protein